MTAVPRSGHKFAPVGSYGRRREHFFKEGAHPGQQQPQLLSSLPQRALFDGVHDGAERRDSPDFVRDTHRRRQRASPPRRSSATMQLSALARRNPLTAFILACTLIILLWRQAANSACSGGSCYRLGNFIDFWLQRELLLSLDASTTGPAAECSQILQGIRLRRFLR